MNKKAPKGMHYMPDGRLMEDSAHKKTVRKMGGGTMKYGMGGMAKYKNGGMPDLTGDGKVTQADVLKGRGVIKAKGGGCMSKKMRPAKYV